jgi:hypothetical protein
LRSKAEVAGDRVVHGWCVPVLGEAEPSGERSSAGAFGARVEGDDLGDRGVCRLMMISSPCSTRSMMRDRFVLASWML